MDKRNSITSDIKMFKVVKQLANPRFVAARLRISFDDDLFEATKDLDRNTKSELIRTGLRMALNIRTQKEVFVREVPVSAPKLFFKGGKTK